MAWTGHAKKGEIVRASTIEEMRNARWDRLRCVAVRDSDVPDTILPGHYTHAEKHDVLADSTGMDGAVYRGKVQDGPLDIVANEDVGSTGFVDDGAFGYLQYIDWNTDDGWIDGPTYWSRFAPTGPAPNYYWTSRPGRDGSTVWTEGANAERNYRCYMEHGNEFRGMIEQQIRLRARSGGYTTQYLSEAYYPAEAGWAPTTPDGGGSECGGVQYQYYRGGETERKILRYTDYIFDLRALASSKFSGTVSDCKLYMYFSADMIVTGTGDPMQDCTAPYGTDILWATKTTWSSTLSNDLSAVTNGPLKTFDLNVVPGSFLIVDVSDAVAAAQGGYLMLRFINHNWQVDPKLFAPSPPTAGMNVNAYTRGDGFTWSCHINMTLSFPDNTNTWGQLGGSEENIGSASPDGMWGQNWGLIPGQYA